MFQFHVIKVWHYSQNTRSSQFYVQSSDPEVILCGWQDIKIKNWLSSLYHCLSVNSIIKESRAHLSVRFRLAFLLFRLSLRFLVAHWCSKVHLHKHEPTSEHSNIHSGLLNTGAAKSTCINPTKHLNIHMFTLVSRTLVPHRPPAYTPPNTWTFTHSLLSHKSPPAYNTLLMLTTSKQSHQGSLSGLLIMF